MLEPKRILIVDDDEVVLEVLLDSVELYCKDCQIFVAADAKTALAQLNQRPFDLILTDYWMPGMNGLDLARTARQISPETRIVLMTGCPDKELQDSLNSMLLEELILKPFSLADLRDILQNSG